jgi:hypothetical protein
MPEAREPAGAPVSDRLCANDRWQRSNPTLTGRRPKTNLKPSFVHRFTSETPKIDNWPNSLPTGLTKLDPL